MNNRTHALLSALFAALLWSSAGMLAPLILWDPVAVAGGRSLVAALTLLPAVVNVWEAHPAPVPSASGHRACSSRARRMQGAMVGAALACGALQLCSALSAGLATPANAVLLRYAAPVYVALCSRLLLGEEVTGPELAGVATAAGGMVLLSLGSPGYGGASSLAGNLLGVGSGLAFAAMVVLLRLQRRGSPVLSLFYGNLLTALLSIPAMLQAPAPDPLSLLILAVAGLVMGISHGIYAAAAQRLTALELVLLPALDPALHPLWAYLAVGKRPSPLTVLGSAVVLLAVVGCWILALPRDCPGPSGTRVP